ILNWQQDQSELQNSFWGLLADPNYNVKNVLGKIGAALGHRLMYNGFGIAAFLLCWLFFIAGARIALQVKISGIRKTLGAIVFLLLWIPTTLAFSISHPVYIGTHGYFSQLWLQSVVGTIGSIFL